MEKGNEFFLKKSRKCYIEFIKLSIENILELLIYSVYIIFVYVCMCLYM